MRHQIVGKFVIKHYSFESFPIYVELNLNQLYYYIFELYTVKYIF